MSAGAAGGTGAESEKRRGGRLKRESDELVESAQVARRRQQWRDAQRTARQRQKAAVAELKDLKRRLAEHGTSSTPDVSDASGQPADPGRVCRCVEAGSGVPGVTSYRRALARVRVLEDEVRSCTRGAAEAESEAMRVLEDSVLFVGNEHLAAGAVFDPGVWF